MKNNQKWNVSLTNDFILSIVLDLQEQNLDILTGYENEPHSIFQVLSVKMVPYRRIQTLKLIGVA